MVSAAIMLPAGTAHAIEPVVEQNLPTITEQMRRGATYSTVPACGAECQRLWLRETEPSAPERLQRELFRLRTRAGMIRFARFAVGGVLGAVATTVAVKIGSKLLTFEEPAKGPSTAAERLSSHDAGDTVYLGFMAPYGTHTFTEPGFAWSHQVGANNWHSMTTTDPNCPGPALPSWLHVIDAGTYNHCGDRFSDTGPGHVTGGWISYWELAQRIDDYVGQPYGETADPLPDPGASADEQDLLDELQQRPDDYRLAEAQWAADLDPHNHDEQTDRDDPCALDGGGTNEDPGLGRGSGETGAEYLRRYEKVPDAVAPQSGFPTVNGVTYLRWGVTTPNVDNSHIEWRGWGYRKIQAKHGWTAADRTATATALLDPAPILDPRSGQRDRYIFIGPEYPGPTGSVCERVVVVEYGLSDDDIAKGATAAAGILTSFGQRANLTDRKKTEALCLKETKEALRSLEDVEARLGKRVKSVYLRGEYPDTEVIVLGERRGGRRWRAALPIWDPSTGATKDGEPLTGLFGSLMLAEAVEA